MSFRIYVSIDNGRLCCDDLKLQVLRTCKTFTLIRQTILDKDTYRQSARSLDLEENLNSQHLTFRETTLQLTKSRSRDIAPVCHIHLGS